MLLRAPLLLQSRACGNILSDKTPFPPFVANLQPNASLPAQAAHRKSKTAILPLSLALLAKYAIYLADSAVLTRY